MGFEDRVGAAHNRRLWVQAQAGASEAINDAAVDHKQGASVLERIRRRKSHLPHNDGPLRATRLDDSSREIDAARPLRSREIGAPIGRSQIPDALARVFWGQEVERVCSVEAVRPCDLDLLYWVEGPEQEPHIPIHGHQPEIWTF